VKKVDGAPLKNALVQLENNEDLDHTIVAWTTADGHFELRNLPAGKYKLSVSRNGYVEAEYGQRKPSDPGVPFLLSQGEYKHDLLFKLIPAAIIAGRVFDEDGEAVPRARVTASREAYNEGYRTLEWKTIAMTDDLGQFRLFGLAPGRYYVSAMDRNANLSGDREFTVIPGQGTERGYVKTYYPGTPDVAQASVITVDEGEEVPGTDISLKRVAVYRVRGKIVNQIALKSGSWVDLQLVQRNKRLGWGLGGGQELRKSDGSFEILDVVPGSYVLSAHWSDEEKSFGTQQRIDVGESDVDGVTLSIGGGVMIPGRILWDGKPSLERDGLGVNLQPTEGMFTRGGAAVAANQFVLKDVGEGEYRVLVYGLSKDCYIKNVEYGGAHSSDSTISVSKGGGAQLQVTISSHGARVQGAATDSDGLPAAGVWVVAVPDETRRSNFRLFKSQTTDQYGKFDLHGLAPGSYKLFSWTGIENNEWEDPDFLKPFEGNGEAVELRDEDSKTVNLKVIEKKSVGKE